ncbi:hypothetical protein NDU88_007990 [Pleurodeles waltl]|uniref:Uncharacterized protein n=1 Tax=Pleurodeles waltl TaxID=8319 RepID=A0AAV7NUQ7_PLEWA|nr:hypothetical protein NDU88_007990 [Pleurodeles waltl]
MTPQEPCPSRAPGDLQKRSQILRVMEALGPAVLFYSHLRGCKKAEFDAKFVQLGKASKVGCPLVIGHLGNISHDSNLMVLRIIQALAAVRSC